MAREGTGHSTVIMIMRPGPLNPNHDWQPKSLSLIVTLPGRVLSSHLRWETVPGNQGEGCHIKGGVNVAMYTGYQLASLHRHMQGRVVRHAGPGAQEGQSWV